MKFTVSWLKDHLETQASVKEITDKLTSIGLELEGIEDPAAALGEFTVAEVLSAAPHPDADRLQVLMVKTANNPEPLQVVCGAPNARAGMKGILAQPGTYVPGLDIKLKKSKIRGVESHGMMASERELCLGEDHDGIIDLDQKWAIGTPIAEVLGLDDPIIDIAITPNRADCTGVYGVARDLAAAGMGTLKTLDTPSIQSSFGSPISISFALSADDEVACSHFMGRTIKGVKNGPSPQWLQTRLKAIGLRPISTLVDITNYFCIGLCRPLHVFDADKLQGNLQIRMAKKGENLSALNDKDYVLDDFMTVVADDQNALALGGVVGGTSSGCTEDTQNVFLECAYFDPFRTAKTGRALQIDSDARYRFERGIDPNFTAQGLDLATAMILELCGGEASEITQAGSVPKVAKTVAYDPAYCEKIIGLAVDSDEQKAILGRLGFTVNDNWSIDAPSWRADIDGKADIVEEVIRIIGYDKIPTISVTRTAADNKAFYSTESARIRKSRLTLAARGMNETISYAFMGEALAEAYGSNRSGQAAELRLQRPISEDLVQMRPSILPNLIDAAKRNTDRGYGNVALFEVGPSFGKWYKKDQTLTATGIRTGKAASKHWSSAEADRDVDLYDIKADVENVLGALGFPASNAQVTRDAPDYYHPGRSATLRLGKNILAHFGDIHPSVLEKSDFKDATSGFEVFIDNIPVPKKKASARKALLKLEVLQPLNRDFAFIVEENLDTDSLIRAISNTDKQLITGVNLFDVYQGKGVDKGKKSIAITVTIQPREQTLTDEDIEALSKKIIANAESKCQASLRA
tara:strand:- start:76843 stop:79260 length:2418 start_codon:yes stop_codon:yes gene_type:complete